MAELFNLWPMEPYIERVSHCVPRATKPIAGIAKRLVAMEWATQVAFHFKMSAGWKEQSSTGPTWRPERGGASWNTLADATALY